jgi:hypothetical protein
MITYSMTLGSLVVEILPLTLLYVFDLTCSALCDSIMQGVGWGVKHTENYVIFL